MEDELTQPLTQKALDPRRLGRNNSGLSENDISDVLCILHPTSPGAFRVVQSMALSGPRHVLQNGNMGTFDPPFNSENAEEAETFILDPNQPRESSLPQDLALRLSSTVLQPHLGFVFGRNAQVSDIVLDIDTAKRVSNFHFRIFATHAGVMMIEDVSTNGTLVDNVHLRGKGSAAPATRMLTQGSTISILSTRSEESISFIVRIPARENFEDQYVRNFQAYMAKVTRAEERAAAAAGPAKAGQKVYAQPKGYGGPMSKPSLFTHNNNYGMHWNGGDKYNVVGLLGKGAFATVYMLGTAMDGQLFAAKELEKKRFVKNGQLDQRLDNEMQIMQSLRHPNIVQYIDYHDVQNHLYIIMEYVPYGDLQKYLSEHEVMREADARSMSRQILSSLVYLHTKKITHRDIKPDNILIASEDPFTVKLSDFGLSKVVKNNDTFLKTFCGTLLYCAPEVFPHYDSHAEKRGVKRQRQGNSQKKFHAYSQSVDVWSFAAVLWFALCGKPPFEGVVDNTGKGMFDRIMSTTPDIQPLLQCGISNEAIDLLLRMLNTDPSKRPTEVECLKHPWLYDGNDLANMEIETDLNAIPEEDEEPIDDELGVDANAIAEEQLSQLSIHGRGAASMDSEADPEVEFSSQELEFLDPRQSKRIRPDMLVPRNQMRDPSGGDSSPEVSLQLTSANHANYGDESFVLPVTTPQKRRLFGEIGQSALQSSGVLDEHAGAALSISQHGNHELLLSQESITSDTRNQSNTSRRRISGSQVLINVKSFQDNSPSSGVISAASLYGAESMVRELNMESPLNANSPEATTNDPSTPKTPESPHTPVAEEPSSLPSEVTPKPRTSFNRQINLNMNPSLLYESGDAHSHIYAGPGSSISIPATEMPSMDEGSPTTSITNYQPSVPDDDFRRPLPRLGKLTSTKDSFKPIVLKLENRMTTWGRSPENTIQYTELMDTRIPKCALSIWFHAAGIEQKEKDGADWRDMPGLHTIIKAHSKVGLVVNGVRLRDQDEEGNYEAGKIYSGDIITVFIAKNKQRLEFVCEFFHGEAKERRPTGSKFYVEKC